MYNNRFAILLIIFSLFIYTQTVTANTKKEFHFVYIAFSQNDATDYEKLKTSLKKLNAEFLKGNANVIVFFSDGVDNFQTDNLDEWNKLYAIFSNTTIASFDATIECEKLLDCFSRYEFSEVVQHKMIQSNFNSITWHAFVGSGYWNAKNNENILGLISASCGFSDNIGSKFELNIYHDSDDPILKFDNKNALGKYCNFITDSNTKLVDY